MIEVTERAKQELKRILSDNVDNPLAALRLSATNEGGLGLSIDVEKTGDKVVECEDSKVLLVEEALADDLTGVTLDVEDTEEGPRLTVFKESESTD
jgi:Fe-S cluster assembly iron-binding protein IscA